MIHKEICCDSSTPVIYATFVLPADLWAEQVHLVGDFDSWNRQAHPMSRNQLGQWVITIRLEANRAYQFRYLIDDDRWTNDDNADAYVRNYHGSDNFVVITDLNFRKYLNE